MKGPVLLLAACLVLSGCFGGGGDDDEGPTGTGTGTGTSTRTGTSGTGTSTGPAQGTIEVVLNRTTADGAAPLTVNFTLDARFTRGGAPVPAPAGLRWSVFVANATAGNGTAGNGTAGNGTAGNATEPAEEGTVLPANVTLTLEEAGNRTVRALVTAPGFAPGNASFAVAVGGGGAGAALFYDGAEGDESQWTLEDELVLDVILERVPTGEPHPEGGWAITDAEARSGTGSWHSPYPDHYEARMTSVAFPAGGTTLTFWAKGGAEDNGNDGLHVLAGPSADALEEVLYQAAVLADWTQLTAELPAGTTVIQFLMYADASCSSDPVAIGGADGTACGVGWDAGGFYLDDITVT